MRRGATTMPYAEHPCVRASRPASPSCSWSNGWFLPNSKHAFTENGYRTQMLVFDPRTLPALPDWDGTKQVPPPPSVSRELVHSTDVLPTALGYALDATGSQSCPISTDGTSCDGKDLRPYVFPASTGGGPSAPLRHSLCGHHTQQRRRRRSLLSGRSGPDAGAMQAAVRGAAAEAVHLGADARVDGSLPRSGRARASRRHQRRRHHRARSLASWRAVCEHDVASRVLRRRLVAAGSERQHLQRGMSGGLHLQSVN